MGHGGGYERPAIAGSGTIACGVAACASAIGTVTILARSESLDSLTLDGPRGRATLGLRPAALIRVLPGDADPGLFHRVPES